MYTFQGCLCGHSSLAATLACSAEACARISTCAMPPMLLGRLATAADGLSQLRQLLFRQQPLAHNERQDAAMQQLQQVI